MTQRYYNIIKIKVDFYNKCSIFVYNNKYLKINNMNNIPKYSKIELFNLEGVIDETYENCGMFITNDTIIVVKETVDSIENITLSEGTIHSLSLISKYKTYK